MPVPIPRRATVVFLGDSVTHANRRADRPDDLGAGWVAMAARWFARRFPAHETAFHNRGVGGDRLRDLRLRWHRDCVALAPDVATVLIGINDTWRRFDWGECSDAEEFEHDYRSMLAELRAARPGVVLLLGEPFVVPVRDEQRRWRADLDPKIEIVHRLAEEFGATLLTFDRALNHAARHTDPAKLCPDGVHPARRGHEIIAALWCAALAPDATA